MKMVLLCLHEPCILSRYITACADGYLTPCIKKYVSGFVSGFKDPVSVVKLVLLCLLVCVSLSFYACRRSYEFFSCSLMED